MFKRKNDFEQEITLPLFEPEEVAPSAQPKKNNSYHSSGSSKQIPPRIFEQEALPSSRQTFPKHLFNKASISAPQQETEDSYVNAWDREPETSNPMNELQKETPETTLGKEVSLKGHLKFERLLRIDGEFEGELVSQGKLIVGPTGKVKSNINLREAIIEGCVEGDIIVTERLELRGEAKIYGNIKATSISVDEGVTIIGNLNISPKVDKAPSDK